ncbi:hypothetical protein BKA70DRAFT_1294448 [Coprinopsis sp. MPI-PUGE-AT-0042]|nr:hypothetical protein BKA70DRAFT_1294448 [Coprinopsis sp. MPI-PUGE-AT-0042]
MTLTHPNRPPPPLSSERFDPVSAGLSCTATARCLSVVLSGGTRVVYDQSKAMASSCANGIPVNADITGPGVRIALYVQSILSVILVRVSPKDAPGAYWSMTATAMSLIISSFITGVMKEISLLDAIVVVYVLILPIVASAFGVSHLSASPQASTARGPTALRRVSSPLLIIANWLRSALTYAFALYVWIQAPSFGQSAAECNPSTKLIFWGKPLPALGSGRILNLVGWGILSFFFVWRTFKGLGTLAVSFAALLGLNGGTGELVRPKVPPRNQMNLETYERYDYRTEEREHRERAYRPGQIFHAMLRGIMSQILGLAPAGSKTFYGKYGQLILAVLIAAWAIAMTELELRLNDLDVQVNDEWGFGQILPLILTIAPLLSLWEAILTKRARGPLGSSETTAVRFTIQSAKNLSRRHRLPPDEDLLEKDWKEEEIEKLKAPSPFAVLTIDEKDVYTTFDLRDTRNPGWKETFDVQISETSTIVVRIFDLKCMGTECLGADGHGLIGYTTILPSAMRWEVGKENSDILSAQTDSQDSVRDGPQLRPAIQIKSFPLVRDSKVIPGTTFEASISTDTSGPIPPPDIPAQYVGLERTTEERTVAMVKWRGRRRGFKETTLTETYNLQGD